MKENTCLECNEVFNDSEQVRRHLRKHGMTFQQYSLRYNYNGVEPTCKCECGKQTSWNVALKGYAEFVLGHHAWGRKKSDEEKQKIGRANAENMTRYMNENPDIAKQRSTQMLAAHTPEMTVRRLEATRQTYAAMTPEDKQKFSDHAQNLWDNERELMDLARKKAAKTFKQRSANGEYDFTTRNENLSRAIAQKYVDGTWKFAKGTHLSTKTGRECYYRSSWELLLMKELDVDPDVIDWESEFTSIPYVFEGSAHRYVPDFKVVRLGCTQLVEVKPQDLRETDRNVLKRQAALIHCESLGWQYVEWEPI